MHTMTTHLTLSGVSVVVFPGQGAQRTGMARDFCEEFPCARAVFDEASDALGLDLKALCFEPDARLDLTEFTQPALLTTELAMLRTLTQHFGLAPTHFGGHSLGEYSALCAAGVITLADAVRLVRLRGALMQKAVPPGKGAMAALIAPGIGERISSDDLTMLGVDLANRNSTDQVVLSGELEAMNQALQHFHELFRAEEHRIVKLQVSAPFHSHMMNVIERDLGSVLDEASTRFDMLHAACVTSNRTGSFHPSESRRLVENLTKQASTTVEWIANMRELASVAGRIYEVGPGRALGAFFRTTLDLAVTSLGTVRAAHKELSS